MTWYVVVNGEPVSPLPVVYDDGGRVDAGFRGVTGDCVTRAFAIASGRPYKDIYDLVNELAKGERKGKRKRGVSSARTGVYKATQRKLAEALGMRWVPLMGIGTGCQAHCRQGESWIPAGRAVLSLSKHASALIDGVIRDTQDPCRGGSRCVYGYWILEGGNK